MNMLIIQIETKDNVVILVEATPYLGKLYSYVSVRHRGECRPTIRVLAPIWVWRRVKKMLRNGGNVYKFILDVFKEYAVINTTTSDKRIYYEEPFRLLPLLF